MSHKRELIIAAIVDRLKAAATPAGERVLTDPAAALRLSPAEMPAILVRPEAEEPAELQETGEVRRYRRDLLVRVEAVAAATAQESPDALVNALDLALEQTIQADETMGGLAFETILAGTEFAYSAEGGEAVGAVIQSYLISYQFPE